MQKRKISGRPKAQKPNEFHLYIPEPLAGQIRVLAQEGRRPLNSQILLLVEDGMKRQTLPA